MNEHDKVELANLIKEIVDELGLDGCVILTKKGKDACFIGGGINAQGKSWAQSVRQAIDLLYKVTNEEADKQKKATPNN